MELWLALQSPLWWTALLLATVLLSLVWPPLARRLGSGSLRHGPTSLQRSLRLRCLAAGLLVLANLSMLVVLAAANLHTPRLAGPVGLTFLVVSVLSLLLAWLLFAESRAGRQDREP